MARLDKTLIDYLIIAISPALIMTLVGSLVFFLLDVFYKGNYAGRLEVIFALFVFAAVLVARISIEEGRERAMLFAGPLAIVTMLAIMRFVQFQGALQAFSFFINIGLIGIVWWSANKLTWDCTMIDEEAEDSGEGLLEAVGLDTPGKAAIEKEIAPAKQPDAVAPPENSPKAWWQRFLERRKRPHAPGVWVVYFSLAALPLFGIGQFFIPVANQENRRYAFQLLFIYTASGLALLLATSFLGLRRYLRQRRQEMPLPIVNFWLGIGGILIVAAMVFALLLPRTNAEYDLSELALRVGSPDQNSSQYGVGSEGVEEDQPDAQSEPREDEKSNATTNEKSDKTDESQSDENSKSEKSSGEGDKSEKSESSESKKNSQDQADSEKKQTEKSSTDSEKSAEKDEKDKKEKKKQEDSKSSGGSSSKKESPKKNEEKKKDNQSGGGKSHAPAMPRLSSPAGMAWLVTLFKWIFYLVLAALILYAMWRYREEIWKAICDFVQFLADLWSNLFGGAKRRAEAAAEAEKAKKPLRRFADFADPFAAGVAGRYPPAELVRYTFNALEAWARDRGLPRAADQTPHEFVRDLAVNAPSVADDAAQLADLYCQVAYAPFTLPAGSAAQLAQLWRIMRTESSATNPASIGQGA